MSIRETWIDGMCQWDVIKQFQEWEREFFERFAVKPTHLILTRAERRSLKMKLSSLMTKQCPNTGSYLFGYRIIGMLGRNILRKPNTPNNPFVAMETNPIIDRGLHDHLNDARAYVCGTRHIQKNWYFRRDHEASG